MSKRQAKNFGRRLAKLLHVRHLTQVELAKKSGTTQAMISAIVNGKREPTLDTAVKIANALSESLDGMVQA